MTTKTSKELLADLTAALDAAYWSSWQSTATFEQQRKAAQAHLLQEKLRDAGPALFEMLSRLVTHGARMVDVGCTPGDVPKLAELVDEAMILLEALHP